METITHRWLQDTFKDDYDFILTTVTNLLKGILPETAILLKGERATGKTSFKQWLYDLLEKQLFICPEIVNIIFIETNQQNIEIHNIPTVHMHSIPGFYPRGFKEIIADRWNFISAILNNKE
jgi:predicted AAA+ superfamily ATPase